MAKWPVLRRASPSHWLFAIVALALLVRVVVVLVTPHYRVATDAADYDRVAVSLVQHHSFPASSVDPAGGPSALRPPLFPLALAVVYKLVGVASQTTRWEAGRLLEALLGAITVALIYAIALRLWGRAVALLSGAIGAVYPPLVLIGSSLMTESLFIPLALASVLSALISRESPHGRRWAALAGVLIGLGTLTRGNGIALLIPIAFLVWSTRPRLSLRSLGAPLVCVLAALLTLVPWTVRNEQVFHQFVPVTTETGYVTAGTYNSVAAHRTDFPAIWTPPVSDVRQVIAKHPRLNEAALSDRLNTLALDYVRAHPAYLLKVFWWNGLRLLSLPGPHYERWGAVYEAYPLWLATLSVYTFWLLGLLCIGGALTAAARGVPLAIWGCPLAVFLSTVFLQGGTRYRSPADPFLIMLAALGVLAGQRWWRVRRSVPSLAG